MQLVSHRLLRIPIYAYPPRVPPLYGRKVVAAYRRGKLTEARVLELLWGTVDRSELPAQEEVPLEAWRRELSRSCESMSGL